MAHDWQDTGVDDIHIEFMRVVKGQHRHDVCYAHYLRCSVCGQVGFRRPHSRVIYTWRDT